MHSIIYCVKYSIYDTLSRLRGIIALLWNMHALMPAYILYTFALVGKTELK